MRSFKLTYALLLAFLMITIACKETAHKASSTKLEKATANSSKTGNEQRSKKNQDKRNNTQSRRVLVPEGTYVNISNEDAIAGCSTITVDYTSATPLCIEQDSIIIKVRF